MSETYGLDHHGHRIEVEADDSGLMSSRVQLLVDGRLVDEQETRSETSLKAEIPNGEQGRSVRVEVSFDFLGGVKRCVLVENGAKYPMRQTHDNEEDEGSILDFFP